MQPLSPNSSFKYQMFRPYIVNLTNVVIHEGLRLKFGEYFLFSAYSARFAILTFF